MAEKITEAYLRENVWWWRKPTKDWDFRSVSFSTKMKRDSLDTRWKRSLERAAWNYELAIRLDRSDDPPFPNLDAAVQTQFEHIFGVADEPLLLRGENYLTFGCEIWDIPGVPRYFPQRFDVTKCVKLGELWLDPEVADTELTKAFRAIVATLRNNKKLPPAKPRKIHKSASWRWPELMDADHYDLGTLNDSERSLLSDARAQAAKASQLIDTWFEAQS